MPFIGPYDLEIYEHNSTYEATFDGDILFHVDKKVWSKNQIEFVINQINKYYDIGFKDGESNNISEFKKLFKL